MFFCVVCLGGGEKSIVDRLSAPVLKSSLKADWCFCFHSSVAWETLVFQVQYHIGSLF